MQPLTTVEVSRPWHWGIVILSDPSLGGAIPDVDPQRRVSANDQGVVVLVRHAQDITDFEGDVEWAEATITVSHWPSRPEADNGRLAIFEGQLLTPTGRLWVGDADQDVVMGGLSEATSLRVCAPSDQPDSPDRVWVDVWSSS